MDIAKICTYILKNMVDKFFANSLSIWRLANELHFSHFVRTNKERAFLSVLSLSSHKTNAHIHTPHSF